MSIHSKVEAAAFGTRDDWSTWKGTEIGIRIVNFLNFKMDSTFGDSLPSTHSTSKIQAYFYSSKQEEGSSNRKESLQSTRSLAEGIDDIEQSVDIESGYESSTNIEPVFVDMTEFYSYSQPPISFNDYVKRLIY